MKHHHAFTSPTGVLLLSLFWTASLLALTPGEQADSFCARGQAAEAQGSLQATEQCYQLALRVNPGHPAAHAGLKGLAVKLQDPFQTTVFDRFQTSDASLQEVVDYLRGKFHKATQGKYMPDFVWKSSPGSRPITLDLRNGTAAKVLEAVCQQAGLRYQRDGDRVVLYDEGTPPPPLTNSAPSPSAPSPASVPGPSGLATVRIDLNLVDAGLKEALESIILEIKRVTKNKDAINYEIQPSVALSAKVRVSVRLAQASLKEAVDFLQQKFNVSSELRGNVLVFYSGALPPAGQSLSTIPSSAGAGLQPGELLAWTNTSGKTLKAAFVAIEEKSVVLKTAEGKVFRFPLSNLIPECGALAIGLDRKTARK